MRSATALEVAAVAGVSFDLDLVAELVGGDEHLGELLGLGLLVESGPASARSATRSSARRAIGRSPGRADRALHRQLAEASRAARGRPRVLAEHWLAAREMERARRALLASMEAACAAYAYRDAAEAGQRALELWPEVTPKSSARPSWTGWATARR